MFQPVAKSYFAVYLLFYDTDLYWDTVHVLEIHLRNVDIQNNQMGISTRED